MTLLPSPLSLLRSNTCGLQFLVCVEMLLFSVLRELMAIVMCNPFTLSPHSFLAPKTSIAVYNPAAITPISKAEIQSTMKISTRQHRDPSNDKLQ